MNRETLLTGQVALVTGAARGIGAAVVKRLADDGCQVHVTDVEDCSRLVDEIIANGGSAVAHQLDVRDAQACKAIVAKIVGAVGRLDILINNAGICPPGSVVSDIAQWNQVLDVNLMGSRHCMAAAWPVMEAQKSGCIVFVSSMAYYQGGVAVGTEYTTSKAALIGMTRHLARNGGPLGIRCNAVAPGIIDTDMIRGLDIPTAGIPLGRLGTAEEVAGPIHFLCTADARYMTGAVLNITGGMVLAD